MVLLFEEGSALLPPVLERDSPLLPGGANPVALARSRSAVNSPILRPLVERCDDAVDLLGYPRARPALLEVVPDQLGIELSFVAVLLENQAALPYF